MSQKPKKTKNKWQFNGVDVDKLSKKYHFFNALTHDELESIEDLMFSTAQNENKVCAQIVAEYARFATKDIQDIQKELLARYE